MINAPQEATRDNLSLPGLGTCKSRKYCVAGATQAKGIQNGTPVRSQRARQ